MVTHGIKKERGVADGDKEEHVLTSGREWQAAARRAGTRAGTQGRRAGPL